MALFQSKFSLFSYKNDLVVLIPSQEFPQTHRAIKWFEEAIRDNFRRETLDRVLLFICSSKCLWRSMESGWYFACAIMHQLMQLHKCWCKCKYTKAYANTCIYMWMCKHYANTCIMQIHAFNIACKFTNSKQLHVNMQIYAWLRISGLAFGGNRGRLHYIKVKLAMYITASLI